MGRRRSPIAARWRWRAAATAGRRRAPRAASLPGHMRSLRATAATRTTRRRPAARCRRRSPARRTTFANLGFEAPYLGGSYRYAPSGATWTFAGNAGITGNANAFTSGNPAAPEGVQVGFLQLTGQRDASCDLVGRAVHLDLQGGAARQLAGRAAGGAGQGGRGCRRSIPARRDGVLTVPVPDVHDGQRRHTQHRACRNWWWRHRLHGLHRRRAADNGCANGGSNARTGKRAWPGLRRSRDLQPTTR